jgi:hypothetical protein
MVRRFKVMKSLILINLLVFKSTYRQKMIKKSPVFSRQPAVLI